MRVCIAGRATTCWKAHREGDPQTPLVVKDSWQYRERDEEGKLLCEATGKGVVNVARYYHHETVQVRGTDDDIQGGLNIMEASAPQKGWSNSTAGREAVIQPNWRPSTVQQATLFGISNQG
jgi:Fungal protein kinase